MLRVLHIEADENDVLLFAKAIGRSGATAQVTALPSATKAVLYLEGSGLYANRVQFPLPDLIVLGLALPGMSGLEFLVWRRTSPYFSIPAVVLTQSLDPVLLSKALELGASRILHKPITLDELTALAFQLCHCSPLGAQVPWPPSVPGRPNTNPPG